MTSERVPQAPLFNEIDFATEECGELFPHHDEVRETPIRRGIKGDQHVDITVWPEIVSHYGAEQ